MNQKSIDPSKQSLNELIDEFSIKVDAAKKNEKVIADQRRKMQKSQPQLSDKLQMSRSRRKKNYSYSGMVPTVDTIALQDNLASFGVT